MKSMKLKSKLMVSVVVLVSLVVLVGISGFAFNGNLISNNKTDAYVFPITPEDQEKWKEFKSLDEKRAACEIPEEVLKSISTEGLLETCLNYPLFGNFLFHNSYQKGFEGVCKFNGLQELLKRSDAGKCLLKYYKNLDLGKMKSEDKFHALRIEYIEMLIAQESVLSNMDLSERSELIDISLKKLKTKKEKYDDIYSQKGSYILIGRILKKDNPDFGDYVNKNKKFKEFIDKGSNVSATTEELDELIKKFGHIMEDKKG